MTRKELFLQFGLLVTLFLLMAGLAFTDDFQGTVKVIRDNNARYFVWNGVTDSAGAASVMTDLPVFGNIAFIYYAPISPVIDGEEATLTVDVGWPHGVGSYDAFSASIMSETFGGNTPTMFSGTNSAVNGYVVFKIAGAFHDGAAAAFRIIAGFMD